jgi:hypothetical protein
MYKFEDRIYQIRRLVEAEGDLPPPPEVEPAEGGEEPPAEDPAAAAPPPPPPDTIDDGPDDVQKMKLDMVESIRKALVINPNDIDQSLYAKLTNGTSLENLDDMEKTVQELVRNYYPDTEL